MELRAAEVADVCGGHLFGDDVVVSGAAIDSRSIAGGEVFVPLVAARDGHEFIPDALAAGAAAYLTARRPVGGTAVTVADPLAGLRALGCHARNRLPDRVIGVTGSVGKTSVKDLLAACLATRWRTAASARSFNNELGVPLTLFNAAPATEALVVEMGARGLGHIRALCEVARPTVGVVTRVAAVHTEVFGSIDEVARGKVELVEALPPAGTAVLNADDERVAVMAAQSRAAVLTYGRVGDVRAESLTIDDELRPAFDLVSPWGEAEVRLSVRGAHMVENALAAASAALVSGVHLEDLPEGLASAVLSPWRMELIRLPSGAVVLNDAYNANPTSMAAALHSLAALAARRRIAVLGLMAELGPSGAADHRAMADLAAELGVQVIAVGTPHYGGITVTDIDEALTALGQLSDGDAVLVKASRVVGLERVVRKLGATAE